MEQVALDVPDRGRLLTIARQAVDARLPGLGGGELTLEFVGYLYRVDPFDRSVTDHFVVEYTVDGAREQTTYEGRNAEQIGLVKVAIGADGRVTETGVSRGVRFLSRPLFGAGKILGTQYRPVPGDGVDGLAPGQTLPTVDREKLLDIAERAVAAYLPTEHWYELEPIEISYDATHEEAGPKKLGTYRVVFWKRRSIRTTEEGPLIRKRWKEWTVFVGRDGRVTRDGITAGVDVEDARTRVMTKQISVRMPSRATIPKVRREPAATGR